MEKRPLVCSVWLLRMFDRTRVGACDSNLRHEDCDGVGCLFLQHSRATLALSGGHLNQVMFPTAGPWALVFVLGNVLLSQLGLPIPAEPTLIFAGATVFERPTAAIALGLGAVLACVLADVVWFLAGRHFGSRIPQLLCR